MGFKEKKYIQQNAIRRDHTPANFRLAGVGNRRSDFAGKQSTFVGHFIQITTAPKSFVFILDSYIYSMSLPQITKTAATIRRENFSGQRKG